MKCILGLTATATMATIRSISHHLGMSQFEEATVRGKAMPDNLHLSISRDVDKDRVGSLSCPCTGGRVNILHRHSQETSTRTGWAVYLVHVQVAELTFYIDTLKRCRQGQGGQIILSMYRWPS